MTRLTQMVSAALGSEVVSAARARGGDINDAFDVTLADGRRVFVKTNARAEPRMLASQRPSSAAHPSSRPDFVGPSMFHCEARGLDWLRDANAIRVPAVLAVGQNETPFLVLERIASAPPARDFEALLGQRLAHLHRAGATRFGFDEANFIADLPQDNSPCDTWPAFYIARRLQPQLRAAIDSGRAPARWTRDFDRLFARVPELAGPPEPPARLHGDLWTGNVLADEHGAPCLIDPAVYGGHREVDLAMLRLFGGVGPRCFAAYDETWPLALDHADRVRLYQLYPLLVHVNLFGGSYVQSVENTVHAYL
jgi:fructosamine-3-kinase